MVVYTFEQRWEILRQTDLQKKSILEKKIFSDEAHFDLLSYFWHRKPARIHWKTEAPKTSHCLVPLQRLTSMERPLQSMAIIIRPYWTNFCSPKLKRRILATFAFNLMALRATQPKLHSMFCALFLKLALSATELMSFGHLGAAIWHRWIIICRLPSKISVMPASQRQLTL